MTTPLFDSETKTADEPAHPSLRALCETRQAELKDALGRLAADGSPQTRHDIEVALDALDGLLTGNLDQIPPVVSAQLSKWIASSKYLGAKEARELAVPPPAVAPPAAPPTGEAKGGSTWPSS
jgi:hypothetical protein